MYVRAWELRTYVRTCVRTYVRRTYVRRGRACSAASASCAMCASRRCVHMCARCASCASARCPRSYVRTYVRTYVRLRKGTPGCERRGFGSFEAPPLPFFFLRSRGSAVLVRTDVVFARTRVRTYVVPCVPASLVQAAGRLHLSRLRVHIRTHVRTYVLSIQAGVPGVHSSPCPPRGGSQ